MPPLERLSLLLCQSIIKHQATEVINMNKWRGLQILWPAFLAASFLEMCVFAFLDPLVLTETFKLSSDETEWIYAGSFFLFWSATALSSGISCLLLIERP